MEERVFRQKSLKRIESPEELNDYISVTSPAVWMLFVGVVLILVGALVWCVFGTIYSQISVPAYVNGGKAVGYIEGDRLNEISAGMEVRIGKASGVVESVSGTAVTAGEVLSSFMLEDADIDTFDRVYAVNFEVDLPDGSYTSQIITEKISPISFLVN